jgi:hypothetical protein
LSLRQFKDLVLIIDNALIIDLATQAPRAWNQPGEGELIKDIYIYETDQETESYKERKTHGKRQRQKTRKRQTSFIQQAQGGKQGAGTHKKMAKDKH